MFITTEQVGNKELDSWFVKIQVYERQCVSCLNGKHVKSSFKSKKVISTSRPLELHHINLCGPMRV